MKKKTIYLILIVLTVFLAGCKYSFIVPEEVPVIDTTKPITFATQIVPVFNEKCNNCHNSQNPVLTAASAYSKLVPAYVNTASPASSKIYTVATSGTHYAKVSAAQAALILQWITEGAKNN
jgi:hypothetical protein